VPLVLVVAGSDRRVAVPKLEDQIGVALEVYAAPVSVERHQGEHPAAHLVDGDLVAEWVVLDGAHETAARLENLVSRHRPEP